LSFLSSLFSLLYCTLVFLEVFLVLVLLKLRFMKFGFHV